MIRVADKVFDINVAGGVVGGEVLVGGLVGSVGVVTRRVHGREFGVLSEGPHELNYKAVKH